MKSSIFVFASDLHDEGYEQVLDNIQERGGLEGVGIAASYHHSRDLFPHNPVGKIRFLEGEVFFQPDESLYVNTKMRPIVSPLVAQQDPLATLTAKAGPRSLAVRPWTNNMHNTNLGSQHPDCIVQNAFGDPIITSLCPANPDVRAYVCALSANIARYPVDALLVESVIYMPFDHGYHHERTLLPLTGTHRFMMSLCFCLHCMAAGEAAGIDMEQLRQFVRTEMQRVFDGDASIFDEIPLDQSQIGALLNGAMGQFIKVRHQVITSLMTELVAAVKRERDIPVSFMDMSGGLRGVGSGMNVVGATATAPERAWQDGIDFAPLAGVCDSLSVLAYSSDLKQVSADLDAYRQRLPQNYALSVAMRPMLPDCRSAEDVAELVRVISAARPAWIEFYHYAMMRLTSLDWIKKALTVLA